MNADKERLKMLLTETVALLCQRGLTYRRELRVQGLLGITVDDDVFLVPVDERTFTDIRKPFCISNEMELSSPCDLMPRQNDPVVHQRTLSEVPDSKDDLLSSAGYQPRHSQCATVTSKHGLIAASETEVVVDDDFDSSTENEVQPLDDRSGENVSTPEPVIHPVPLEQAFPPAGFRDSMTIAQVHSGGEEMEPEGKRRRKQSTFGDDMLIYSPDNDEWTNSSQREAGEPVAGCSQWLNFGDELKHDVSWDDLNDGSHQLERSVSRPRRARHSGIKNFMCQYEDCNKAFFRKDHLVRHQRQKHGKPFGVESQLIYYCYDGECNKVFYNVQSLRRHMVMIHNYAAAAEETFSDSPSWMAGDGQG